jgi:hypothetical protein
MAALFLTRLRCARGSRRGTRDSLHDDAHADLQDRMSTEPERQGALGDLARYSGLGLQFAATVGVFALLGHWLVGLGLYSMTKKLPSSSRRASARAKDGSPPRNP